MDTTLEVLFILCVIVSFYYLTRAFYNENSIEGFSQNDVFVSKQNTNAYDDFYVSMYDKIHKTRQHTKYDLFQIIKATQPSEKSIFLDVGSGTGCLVNRLRKHGFNAFGIDSSQAMIQHSVKLYPQCEYKCTDVNKTMEFDPDTFSHILCTNFTIYELSDKNTFFKNSKRWLKVGGYLIVHLVDKNEFDTVVPIGKLSNVKNIGLHSKERIQSTSVSLPNLQYINKYSFPESDIVKRVETFTDKYSHKTRHQELLLKIEPKEDIIQLAKTNGFHVKGYANYLEYNEDKHQYLYFFERLDV